MAVTLKTLASDINERDPTSDPAFEAAACIGSLSVADLRRLLVPALIAEIEADRRERARRSEHRATVNRGTLPLVGVGSSLIGVREGPAIDALRAEHAKYCSRDHSTTQSPALALRQCYLNRTPEGREEQRRLKENREARRKTKIEAAQHEAARAAEVAAAGGAFSFAWKKMGELIEDFRQHTRLELTVELLDTVFALGDGTHTTWGDATVEQHTQRIRLLMDKASGTVQTAALHQKAVEIILTSHVKTLREAASLQPVSQP